MPVVGPDDLNRPVREFMKPVATALRADMTVAQAIASLRSRTIDHKIVYFFVVDQDNKLVGVIAARSLLLSAPEIQVGRVMHQPVVSVPADASLELAMGVFAMHRLLALPVVDGEHRLLGMVDVQLYADEMLDLAERHRMADLFQVIGLSLQQVREGSPLMGFRLRMPWLLCNLASGIACALIALMFEQVLDRIVLLAMFFPLVLTLSESISMQSMTIGLQFLHGPGVPWRAVRRRAGFEWKTAALLGLCSAALVGILSIFWGGAATPPDGITAPGVVLGVSILGAMVAAAVLGLAVPVALHAFRLDPKIAAGPVVLMMADVVTTALYLSLATLLLI